MVCQMSGIQQFRSNDRQKELLKVHSVVPEESAQSKGQRRQNAHPAGTLSTDGPVQDKIAKHRRGQSHGGADKLPETETKENAFLVVPDLFVNFDLDKLSPPKKIGRQPLDEAACRS